MTLEDAGHFKTTANTIETVLTELKHNRIDAVLLDLNLPDGDGTRLNHLYGGIYEPETKIIDVFICKLRHKLVENGAEGLSVDAVCGQGYILRETRDYQMLEKAG